jgi:ammonium transporter, Amt family
MRRISALATGILTLAFLAGPALAAEAPKLDSGNTAWVLTSTALVLFMTLPGLALFYGGLVRSRNALSVLLHCVAIACVVSVLWLAVGYSLAFGDGGGAQPVIGGLSKAFLAGVGVDTLKADIPELVFFMFQMTFAIITPALIIGAYPERIGFGAMALFSALWLLAVYVPVCHWVWGDGWLGKMGTMDFAGGIVVHVTAGVSAVVVAAMIGPRHGFPSAAILPHSPGLTMVGAGMLWVGWFGFNAGSALTASGGAALAMTTTHTSAAAGALAWMILEGALLKRVSLVGTVTGLVAGLATITPGAGYVSPWSALVFGAAGSAIGFFATQIVKQRFKIDDSLDVFAVHGLGGATGTILTGIFAAKELGGQGFASAESIGAQLGLQVLGVVAGVAWSAIATAILFKLTAAITTSRVSELDEAEGLDVTQHGERAYDLR